MARRTKKKVDKQPLPPAAADDDGASTAEESVHDGIDTDDEIPDIVDKDDGDNDDEDDDEDAAKGTEEANDKGGDEDKKTNKKKKDKKKDKKKKGDSAAATIPFMDTFYHLSSEDSPEDRSIAARDLIRHCLLSTEVNKKDAAYALTRLMNGLCTGRAASRQGFASCLSSFLRVAAAAGGKVLEDILKEGGEGAAEDEGDDDDTSRSVAAIVRRKLLSTTQLDAPPAIANGKGKKKRFGGKIKGIEARDYAFGRLFGILAVVRSGILGAKDIPPMVVEGYTKDLIDLYHYKKWMREHAAHALIELLSSLDAAETNHSKLITRVVNNVIVPSFFLSAGNENGSMKDIDLADRAQLLRALTPEHLAVALHLQKARKDKVVKFDYPLNEDIVTVDTVSTLSATLSSTSCVVYPCYHVVWNALWMYLTEEAEVKGQGRRLRANKEFPSIVEKIIQHVVLKMLLSNTEGGAAPSNERRSLALQIVRSLCGGSPELKIALPPSLLGTVLCPKVVTKVFVNVLVASGGGPYGKKPKSADGGGSEHHLKPLTARALADLIDRCCEEVDDGDNIERRMAFVKAFLLTDPRFDTKTNTHTLSSLLMLENNACAASEGSESIREALWQQYLSFLEEQIVLATSLHDATVYIELMYRLAKFDLSKAVSGNEARRIMRFFMSGAFFDCLELSDGSTSSSAKKNSSSKKKKKKEKGKTEEAMVIQPQELLSGLRIKEILMANRMACISQSARAIMSARFYSLLSDFVSVLNAPNRGVSKNTKSFYDGKRSRPESIYRVLSEICGICSLLEAGGAKKFPALSSAGLGDDDDDDGDASDAEDPFEASKKFMVQVQNAADDALVKECDGSGDKDILRAKAVFSTGCASLMMALHLQLNSFGKPDANNNDDDDEEEEDDIVETLHEYISDLAECVEGFSLVIEDESGSNRKQDGENPLAALAGLLVNILSSPVGGEGSSGMANPVQASASKLTRETVKLAWSGVISILNSLCGKTNSLKNLVDEDVMSTLIESVCGEKSMGDDEVKKDDDEDSVEETVSSEDGVRQTSVFVNATEAGMDLDEVKDSDSSDSGKESDEENSGESNGEEDVELDPRKLENLLLEDSDAEMSDSGMLEHHAGADKALAQLIKLKQEARKSSQTERERADLCNRLRCAGLLDSFFSPSVFKSGWLPTEAILGSIIPILRSYRLIAKSIQASSLANAKMSLSEKNALLDRLSVLVKDKISKYRCSDDSTSDELALRAFSDVYDEMKLSLNKDHCSCCSMALITVIRCISSVEDNLEVKEIYAGAVHDWSSRKTTKIRACAFDDLIQRMPSLASLILTEPLITAASNAHSAFLKCESIKLLSSIYQRDKATAGEQLSENASNLMKGCCSSVAEAFGGALGDSSLHEVKNVDNVLNAMKHFINYVKALDEGVLTDSELLSLQEALKTFEGSCKNAGMKNTCSQLSDTLSRLARRENENDDQDKPKRSKAPKTSKSSKKQKKLKK